MDVIRGSFLWWLTFAWCLPLPHRHPDALAPWVPCLGQTTLCIWNTTLPEAKFPPSTCTHFSSALGSDAHPGTQLKTGCLDQGWKEETFLSLSFQVYVLSYCWSNATPIDWLLRNYQCYGFGAAFVGCPDFKKERKTFFVCLFQTFWEWIISVYKRYTI